MMCFYPLKRKVKAQSMSQHHETKPPEHEKDTILEGVSNA